jgi:hypothetical protein
MMSNFPTSYEQSKIGIQLDQNLRQKRRPNFFKTNRRSKINHVGIITEVDDNDIKFIHASTSKGLSLL